MVKMIAIYKRPQDTAAFERIYFEQHIPLTKKMPGLRRIEINRITGAARGETDLYLVANLYFDDAEAMRMGLASEESKAAGRVLRDAGADVTFVLADVEEA